MSILDRIANAVENSDTWQDQKSFDTYTIAAIEELIVVITEDIGIAKKDSVEFVAYLNRILNKEI